jgi:type I restriction enzyme R subunit
MNLTESVVEDAALTWLEALGYVVFHGPDIAAGEDVPCARREQPRRGRRILRVLLWRSCDG